MTWLDEAKALSVGGTKKIRHDCAPSRDPSLMISNTPEGYRCYCFRCKESSFEAKVLSLAERVALTKEQREADANVDRQAMPAPLVPWDQWPAEAMLWFLKAGLDGTDAFSMGAGYHVATRRVVLPLLHSYGGLHSRTGVWQARAVFPQQKPKYLTSKGPRGVGLYHFDKRYPSKVVIVEDILSAWKVAQACPRVAAVPLTGTTMHDEHLALILKMDMPALVWLDPDEPGKAAAKKVLRRLEVFGVEADNICLECDPKLMTYERIKWVVY